MADRLKPENKEIVERIRNFEKEMFEEQNFKLYRNYYVPESLVKSASNVLSFGVGGDANFEKLICFDNPNLDVRMFDPTPYTIKNIGAILAKGGHRQFKDYEDGENKSKLIVQNNLRFKPYAYAPTNGKMKFYYKTEQGVDTPEDTKSSFSLATPFDNSNNFVEVDCKNIKTVMHELNWNHIDILKTDVEGLWYEVGKEIQDIDVKYWVTEVEMNLGNTYDEAFDKVRELVEIHKNKYNVYVNRMRLKAMMEIIFCRKDVDESWNI